MFKLNEATSYYNEMHFKSINGFLKFISNYSSDLKIDAKELKAIKAAIKKGERTNINIFTSYVDINEGQTIKTWKDVEYTITPFKFDY